MCDAAGARHGRPYRRPAKEEVVEVPLRLILGVFSAQEAFPGIPPFELKPWRKTGRLSAPATPPREEGAADRSPPSYGAPPWTAMRIDR